MAASQAPTVLAGSERCHICARHGRPAEGLLCRAGQRGAASGRSERSRQQAQRGGSCLSALLSSRRVPEPVRGAFSRLRLRSTAFHSTCTPHHLSSTPLLTMKLLLVLLLSTILVASAARAGGRPKLHNFATPAEAQASMKQLQQMVSLRAGLGLPLVPAPPPPPLGSSHTVTSQVPAPACAAPSCHLTAGATPRPTLHRTARRCLLSGAPRTARPTPRLHGRPPPLPPSTPPWTM